jgi:hypothetical protein
MKISPQSSKTEFGPQNQCSCDKSNRSTILYGARKNILLGVKKMKISPQSSKTEFGSQNQYGRVIYPSIRNFIWSKKKYTFRGQ